MRLKIKYAKGNNAIKKTECNGTSPIDRVPSAIPITYNSTNHKGQTL
jgi:hypothetical protein